jgi:hypothetical protein
MIKKKNILTILITICFVINSAVLFASKIVDNSGNPGDDIDAPPSPINGFIIPMIVAAVLFVGYSLYKNNLIENQKAE